MEILIIIYRFPMMKIINKKMKINNNLRNQKVYL